MQLNPQCPSIPVHRRDISMSSFDLGDHAILFEGRLTDNRFRPGAYDKPYTGSRVVHDFKARLVVQGPDLKITDVSAEMLTHPHEQCKETLPVLSRLMGLEIRPGFTNTMKRLLGGTNGCAHLNTLILNIAYASLQGYFSGYSRADEGEGLMARQAEQLIGTCHVWREGGPLATPLRRKRNNETSEQK